MSSILIIEDDSTLLEMYKTKFEFEKFTVNTAANGEEGIEKIRTFKPDVVLLDLFMEQVSGFDVLREIKKDSDNKNIPVIVLTNVSVDVVDLLNNWGAADVLLKSSATPDDILVKVNQALARTSTPDQP